MAGDTKIDEVVNEIYRRIFEETYMPGQRLPSERDLAEEMHVSRQTIRSALLRLQAENVIDIIPREGASIRTPSSKALIGPWTPVVPGRKEYIGLFTSALKLQGEETSIRFLEPPSIIPAQGAVGLKMNVEVGEKLLRRYRIYLANQIPYRLIDSYYPASLIPDTGSSNENPLHRLQTSTEQSAPSAFERFHCRMPSAQEAELLNMAKNQPVVDIERWIWVDTTTLFEYTHIVANAALHEFTYTYNEANWQALSEKMLLGG